MTRGLKENSKDTKRPLATPPSTEPLARQWFYQHTQAKDWISSPHKDCSPQKRSKKHEVQQGQHETDNCLLPQSLTWEGKYSASLNIIRHEFSPAGSEARAPRTLTGQAAKLALQPAESGPGHNQQICAVWQVRCAMACKTPEHLPFPTLGSSCANYHTDGNLWPRTKPNRTDSTTGKGPGA